MLSSTMTSKINYKDTLFKLANLTPIRGKPTFETLHKLRNEIKANAKAVYSNLGGGAHNHLGLVPLMCSMRSSPPPLLSNRLTRVLSSSHTAQLPMQNPTCGSRTPRKCAFSVKWGEWNKLTCNKSLARLRNHIYRISAIGPKNQ